MWLTQTRYDITFLVCALASALPDALGKVEALRTFLSLSTKMYSRITNQHCSIRFVPLFDSSRSAVTPQIFSFCDASYGTLRNFGSVEANLIVLGIPLVRDGVVKCRGNLISWHTRKLSRVCRSTAQAETLALSNSGEMALYLQVVMAEVFTGRYDISFLRTTDPLPLMSPLKMPPTTTALRTDLARIRESATDDQNIYASLSVDSNSGFQTFCSICSRESFVAWSSVAPTYLSLGSSLSVHSTISSRPSVHALLLSDCANSIAAIAQQNPKTRERTNRLVSAHVRDLQFFMSISYNAAPFNLCDIGTKIHGNVAIYRSFVLKGLFTIGFLTRSECKSFLQTSRKKPFPEGYP